MSGEHHGPTFNVEQFRATVERFRIASGAALELLTHPVDPTGYVSTLTREDFTRARVECFQAIYDAIRELERRS